MTTVKMGDQLLLIGCADAGRLGAIALRVGLSGRAVAVVPDEGSAMRMTRGAAEAGALVDVHMAPLTTLPLEDGEFDLVVVDDTGGLLASLRPEESVELLRDNAWELR